MAPGALTSLGHPGVRRESEPERAPGAWAFVLRLLRARELATMLLVAVAAGGLWAFLELADAIADEQLRALDESVLLAMREPSDPTDPVGPRWVEEMGRDFTALGGNAILTLVSLAVALFLWMARRPRSVALLLVTVVGGQVLSLLLKRGFARPRPDLVPHESFVYTASFPSGHSMMSAVVYLTLGALLARVLPRRRMKLLVIACALFATALTGVSRVYLGVHWPTDVVGGWAIGASWAVACWLVAEALDRRRPAGTPREGSESAAGDDSAG
jgi:undecaprenyl-diphosphatase